MHITLNFIRKRSPCTEGWGKLLSYLGKTKADDEMILLSTVLESNGLDDALWCLCALPEEYDSAIRLLVCDLVEPALAFVPDGEGRPRNAVDIARKFANGEASSRELDAARMTANVAVSELDKAADATRATNGNMHHPELAALDAARAARDTVEWWSGSSAWSAAQAARYAAMIIAASLHKDRTDWAAWDAAKFASIDAQGATFTSWLLKMEGTSK